MSRHAVKHKANQMDAKHPEGDETSVTGRDRPGVVVSRRRFTRAGLSGSVVLGSLVSRPVLGAVPYHCTVSGQVSGNLSRAAAARECVIGRSPSDWLGETTWPLPFVKGNPPNSTNCSFTGRIRGTNFNGYSPGGGVPALIGAFYNSFGGSLSCTVGTSVTSDPSTMLQVLSTTNGGEQFLLGRVVVTSLLNAAKLGNFYPATTHAIIAMFNATFGGGNYYPVDGTMTVTWNRTRVIEYLSSLYPA